MKAPRLIADVEHGEGSLKFSDAWHSEDALLRADLLKDWLYDLNNEYNRALIDFRRDLERRKSLITSSECVPSADG